MADEYVEPAHEALIQAWDKVLEWRKEEAEKLPLQRAITQATYGTGGLWTNDKRLSQAEELLTADPYWLNTAENRFIKESLRQRKRNGQTLWGSVISVILVLSVLTVWALMNAAEARHQTGEANYQAQMAQLNARKEQKQAAIAKANADVAGKQTKLANQRNQQLQQRNKQLKREK